MIIFAYATEHAPQMPSPALKFVSMRQDNTQIASLGGWEEVGTVDGGGKVTQDRMIDDDGAKVTAKKRGEKNVKLGGVGVVGNNIIRFPNLMEVELTLSKDVSKINTAI